MSLGLALPDRCPCVVASGKLLFLFAKMEQNSDTDQTSSSSHEYPDPDSAAYTTSYPWVRNVSASGDAGVSHTLFQQPYDYHRRVSYDTTTLSAEETSGSESFGQDILVQEDDFDVDSEYLASDNAIR